MLPVSADGTQIGLHRIGTGGKTSSQTKGSAEAGESAGCAKGQTCALTFTRRTRARALGGHGCCFDRGLLELQMLLLCSIGEREKSTIGPDQVADEWTRRAECSSRARAGMKNLRCIQSNSLETPRIAREVLHWSQGSAGHLQDSVSCPGRTGPFSVAVLGSMAGAAMNED